MGSFDSLFLFLIMLFVAVSMRMVPEQQRIALFRRGQYAGLKGPGMVLVIPYLDRAHKISIGDRGVLLEDGTARFGEFAVPVVFSRYIAPETSVQVVGFTKDGPQVV
ncbi:MAG: hypothetical protein GXY72_11280 [Deltaproteobacteria bacterium]|nr:hypothetical protein [Syntrophaceae bacterium]NLX52667.1 hypothetical protein [Deltaproteobacteria bacterium]